MTKHEFENLKFYYGVLKDRMKERDEDCSNPKNAIDKGYNLAVTHMNCEIDEILHDLEVQIK